MANQHVVKRGTEWAVLKEGGKRDTAILDTQAEAIKVAKEIAENQGGDVIVHNRHGQIDRRNTYGKPDPYPPTG